MIESAGRVADGLLGHTLFTPSYIDDVVLPAIERGAAQAERDPADVTIATLRARRAVADDAELARREAAAMIAFYASAKTYAAVLETLGFGAEGGGDPRGVRAPATWRRWSRAVTDAMVDEFAVAGTPTKSTPSCAATTASSTKSSSRSPASRSPTSASPRTSRC